MKNLKFTKDVCLAEVPPGFRFRESIPFLTVLLRGPLKAGKGACLHAEVLSFAGARQAFRHAGVAISYKEPRLLPFTRNDNFLNRDLGTHEVLTTVSINDIQVSNS